MSPMSNNNFGVEPDKPAPKKSKKGKSKKDAPKVESSDDAPEGDGEE